jgi:cytochrome c oxidase cbb3-type subunit I
MSPSLSSAFPLQATPAHAAESPAPELSREKRRQVMAVTAWHSLFWLVVANCVGVLLALLLIFPRINNLLGQWTYGRWMPVHMNLQLYGWCSLPLIAFLFHVYGADQGPLAAWCRPVLWIWSGALGVGVLSWLNGHTSGKLFLDWVGFPRVLFPLALLSLWGLLTASQFANPRPASNKPLILRLGKAFGLVLLLMVPFLLYVAASPTIYPPVNPDTGGPTGASQLESTLVIIAILLLIPFGLTTRKTERSWIVKASWLGFTIESLLCLGLGRADVSHHRATQWLSLGSLLLWILLIPAYYERFLWHPNSRRWRIAFLCWWSILIPTGWMLFLPGVLDHFKFTDGLVGHSFLAMVGFVSSLLIFVMVELLAEDGWIFNGTASFYFWQGGALGYSLIMFFAGWREGVDPSFSMVPGTLRNSIYTLRLIFGMFILLASLDWFKDALSLANTTPLLPHDHSKEVRQ